MTCKKKKPFHRRTSAPVPRKYITIKHRERYTMFVHDHTCHLSVCILQIIRVSIECFKSIIFSSITVYYRDTGPFSRAAAPALMHRNDTRHPYQAPVPRVQTSSEGDQACLGLSS